MFRPVFHYLVPGISVNLLYPTACGPFFLPSHEVALRGKKVFNNKAICFTDKKEKKEIWDGDKKLKTKKPEVKVKEKEKFWILLFRFHQHVVLAVCQTGLAGKAKFLKHCLHIFGRREDI